MQREHADPKEPTAVAPDEVAETVPGATERAGKTGPNAADPPRAKRDSDDEERPAQRSPENAEHEEELLREFDEGG